MVRARLTLWIFIATTGIMLDTSMSFNHFEAQINRGSYSKNRSRKSENTVTLVTLTSGASNGRAASISLSSFDEKGGNDATVVFMPNEILIRQVMQRTGRTVSELHISPSDYAFEIEHSRSGNSSMKRRDGLKSIKYVIEAALVVAHKAGVLDDKSTETERLVEASKFLILKFLTEFELDIPSHYLEEVKRLEDLRPFYKRLRVYLERDNNKPQ